MEGAHDMACSLIEGAEGRGGLLDRCSGYRHRADPLATAPRQWVQTAALKPSPNSCTFPPMVIGMTPEIGPPASDAAGV